MKHNKGFTLIELMISITIFSILALSVMGFIVVGSHSHAKISNSINLQTQSQQTMAQMQEYLIDCNGGIVWDNDRQTLAVVNSGVANFITPVFITHLFRYDKENKKLFYGETQFKKNVTAIPSLDTLESKDLMSTHLTAFSISLPDTAIPALTVKMTFAYRGASQDTTQKISLRNQPISAATYEDLIKALQAN